MKAAVCREFGKPLSIEDVYIAAPGPGEVTVNVKACAICHSDILYMEGAWGGDLPAVFGHEAAGVVEEAGPGVDGLSAGDHVAITLIRSCGRCARCAQGDQVLCEATFPLDRKPPLTSCQGHPIKQGLRAAAFAEFVVVDASQAVAIPKELSFESGALIGCGVLTGFGAVVNTAAVPCGAAVVVIGTGGVGLNSVQGAALSGARTIIAVDPSDAKLAAARRFGATHAIDPRREDVGQVVRALTDGRGADYVFIAVGAKGAIEQGFDLMRRGGTLVVIGMPASGVMATFDPGNFAHDGQRLLGSKMGSARVQVDIPKIVSLYQQGRLKLNELITARYQLEDINEAIAAARGGDALRNVIIF
jgi:Zn-dependent alcohol dehydrogenase